MVKRNRVSSQAFMYIKKTNINLDPHIPQQILLNCYCLIGLTMKEITQLFEKFINQKKERKKERNYVEIYKKIVLVFEELKFGPSH